MTRTHRASLLVAVGAVVLFALEVVAAHVKTLAAVPDVLRIGLPALAFLLLTGYGPAVLLAPGDTRAWVGLHVAPIGAAVSALSLAVLGLVGVPWRVALALVIGASAVLAVVAYRGRASREPVSAAALALPVLLPVLLAVLVAGLALAPTFRAGYVTTNGQNGDAILAVGTAHFLQHAPPRAVRPELPLDRVPPVWRSKYPIYYDLAAASTLSGRDTTAAFGVFSALILALASVGVFLFVADVLGAGAGTAAAAAMFLVALDRIVVHVAIHPFYNQLWALFAFFFVLHWGHRFLTAPSRGALALLALFLALAIFTYPLLLPFPVVFLGVLAWRERSGDWRALLRRPATGRARVLWLVPALLAVPALVLLGAGVVEKAGAAARAVLPGGDLSAWGGTALPYFPFGRFFGMDAVAVPAVLGTVAVFVLAAVGLRRASSPVRWALGALGLLALLIAAWFRIRGRGELFYFKSLGFLGPLVVAAAVAGGADVLARLRDARTPLRVLAGAAALVLVLGLANGARREIRVTYPFASREVLALAEWDRTLPPNATIRIDVPRTGFQLWSWYEMPRHKLCALHPLGEFFPHPPYGTRGDLILIDRTEQGPPPDAVGPPLRANARFAMFRGPGGGHGPQGCSQGLIWAY